MYTNQEAGEHSRNSPVIDIATIIVVTFQAMVTNAPLVKRLLTGHYGLVESFQQWTMAIRRLWLSTIRTLNAWKKVRFESVPGESTDAEVTGCIRRSLRCPLMPLL